VGVLIARTPFKCPAAPYEAAFLIDEVIRKEGVREKVQKRNSLQHRKNGAESQPTKETSAL
jgi:hypothetical protein